MAQCEAQQFNNISPAQFACLMATAKSQGIEINGANGQATQGGITISWSYNATSNSLTIQCQSSPFYLTCGVINAKIHDLVDQCQTQVA